jgi:D-inositol-3-phosphate glycosyltransferase
VEDRVIAEADTIIAECPQDEQDLRILYEADPAKIEIIPCGFDPAEVWPMEKSLARRILGLRQEERIILHLGRMVPRKGVDNVIRGFARLVRDYGIKARLLIVGGGSEKPDPVITPEIGRLQEVAREEGVEGYVTFVGRRGRKAIKYLYSAADVFVSTPWYEPFGITPVEAMACGTPVIGSDVGGIKYTVQDGKTGYLVPPDDPDILAERLADLYGNPVRMRHFSQQSIRRVNELFTWQKVADSIGRMYEKVLTGAEPEEQMETAAPAGTVKASDLTTGFGQTGPLSPAEIETVEQGFKDALDVLRQSRKLLVRPVWLAANAILETLAHGGKVMVCGNGGGAAEAQHFAAELLGRFRMKGRPGLPVIALTADTSFLSDWAKEASYEDVFARQVQAIGRRGDLLIGLGTHGDSPNLVQAFRMATSMGINTLPFLGGNGGELAELARVAIVVPDKRTPRIQEIQLLALHMICDLIEHHMASAAVQPATLEPMMAAVRSSLNLRPSLSMRMERPNK